MDVSVLAAVGSFVVSERVLKPKATVLVILGCVLAYDLTTKTRDVSSLRVYRGPALLAFTLMMVAYSLRTWRRNGVACDELLFLPGTVHGQNHGIDSPPVVSNGAVQADDDTQQSPQRAPSRSEGDVAAGVGPQTQETTEQQDDDSQIELVATPPARNDSGRHSVGSQIRNRSLSKDSSVSSIQEFVNSWDEDENNHERENDNDDREDGETAPLNPDVEELERGGGASLTVRTVGRGSGESGDPSVDQSIQSPRSGETTTSTTEQNAVDRFRQNHPRITRIGSFFFFRSSTTSTHNAEYAPSGPSVVGAALDMSMPILFNFHLFIEAFNHMGDTAATKILPLIFLSVLIVRTCFPPGRRGRFWSTMKFTFMAPFHKSRFRDLYIGDVLTSLIRPFQDVLFALSYYITVVWGTITGKYGLSTSGEILERSWILHNVILPSCALLPLWFKFLQTLRESYDAGQRWPYLGNAFKYLSAALVILYGMTHPEDRRSPLWLICFALTLLYQIWWDTVMDWELFVIAPRQDERDLVTCMIRRIPSWKQIQLRPRRLYKNDAFYWRIFAYNAIMRFTWMLCFIPAYHLSASGEEQVTTFSSDTITYVGVLLPVAEILRRALWGFLFLEMKTIKMTDGDPSYSRLDTDSSEEMTQESEVSVDTIDSSKGASRQYLPTWLGTQQQLQQEAAAPTSFQIRQWFQFSNETLQKLFIVELSLWAATFVMLGAWATN